MTLMKLVRLHMGAALAVASLAAACGVDSGNSGSASAASDDGEHLAAAGQEIINGTVPAPGGLASYGVVSLGGCTGTLLDNRHVITAHHCVRAFDETNGTWGALATSIIARYEDGGAQQTAGSAQIFEPTDTWTLDAHDYSIIALAVPFKVNGSSTGFSNPIYASADSTLLNQNVLCIGYGGTVAATSTTFASGFDTLTSATMKVTSTSSGVLVRPANASGQVGFGGDSGSTCFLNGSLLGIQSTCGGAIGYDVNHNGTIDGWAERSAPTSCNAAAPGQFRSWAATQLAVAVNTNFAYSAALAGGVI